ncbi:MAG: NUDIX domain-containing protein [Balneolaceae bacterium]|nr:NUDIX domain-containing protein [Balneolaceae bacterium]
MIELVDVYPYRFSKNQIEFFTGKRSTSKIYSGQWRMVGGKVEQGETAWQAALREMKEEVGVEPVRFWSPPTLNQFYEPKNDTIHHIPVFAAEISPDAEITLNDEHQQLKWITIEQVEQYIHWPEQARIMGLIHSLLSSKEILKEWELAIRQ